MNKQVKTQRIPKLLIAALILIYFVGAAYLMLGLLFLLSSSEWITEWNNGIQPVNKTAVGLIYIAIGAMSLVSGWFIHKRRPNALPITIILLLPITGGLLQASEHYSGVQYAPLEYIIYGLLDAIFFSYLLFSKKVRTYLES